MLRKTNSKIERFINIFCRCVVGSLTEEGPTDLAEELGRNEAVQTDENLPSDEDAENWETWMPDPVNAEPGNVYNYTGFFLKKPSKL